MVIKLHLRLRAFFQQKKLFTLDKHFHGAPQNIFPPVGEKKAPKYAFE